MNRMVRFHQATTVRFLDREHAEWKAKRAAWQSQRAAQERYYKEFHKRKKIKLDLFGLGVGAFGKFIKATGMYRHGKKNALDLRLIQTELFFKTLPPAFDGYTILHLSDLHIDSYVEVGASLIRGVQGIHADLCVITGDFQGGFNASPAQTVRCMEALLKNLKAPDGIIGTLGNHDSVTIVEPLEKIRIDILSNETISLNRDGYEIFITGLDDVHSYYSDFTEKSLRPKEAEFNILLVHSPGIVQVAADAGFDLYLCGHTHGGQVRFPLLPPIVTRMKGGRRFATGQWKCDDMVGITTNGIGVSMLPIRFGAPPEIWEITLRRGA